MNKNVLRTSIILVIILLVFQYILKIFFPQEFVFAISNSRIIAFGKYVDNHLWISIPLDIIFAFITYYLYLCAITYRLRPTKLQLLSIIACATSVQLVYWFLKDFILAINVCSFIVLACIFKANIKTFGIVFCIHMLSQSLSLSIRNLQILINVNYASFLLLAIDCYFWLLLFYLYFNYENFKREVSKDG